MSHPSLLLNVKDTAPSRSSVISLTTKSATAAAIFFKAAGGDDMDKKKLSSWKLINIQGCRKRLAPGAGFRVSGQNSSVSSWKAALQWENRYSRKPRKPPFERLCCSSFSRDCFLTCEGKQTWKVIAGRKEGEREEDDLSSTGKHPKRRLGRLDCRIDFLDRS